MVKKCFVPGCGNSTSNNPIKLFILVSLNKTRRNNWFRAVNLEYVPKGSHVYCCEDHFDMEQDADNWQEYKIVGTRLRMKPDVVPHKFITSPKPAELSGRSQFSSASKRRKMEALKGLGETVLNKFFFSDPSTSHHDFSELHSPEELPDEPPAVELSPVEFKPLPASPVLIKTEYHFPPEQHSKGVQYKVPCRSMSIMTDKVSTANKSTNTMRVLSETEPTATFRTEEICGPSSVSFSYENQSDRRLVPNPRFYLGLPKETFNIVKLLTKHVDLDAKHILLCLKKIRMDASNDRLADDFFMSPSCVEKLLIEGFPILADVFIKFIVWPEAESIEVKLPLPFRLNYRKVQSILDCFEVQITTSNPSHRALTGSNHKRCNTMKYLISATPYGLVNFISNGFEGKTSNKVILKNCNYFNALPTNCIVIADRGFKQALEERGNRAAKPLGVTSSNRPSKKGARETKKIAASRIHIERTIRRLREYKMLEAHSCSDKKLLYLLDLAVTIVCGMINLQGPLIK